MLKKTYVPESSLTTSSKRRFSSSSATPLAPNFFRSLSSFASPARYCPNASRQEKVRSPCSIMSSPTLWQLGQCCFLIQSSSMLSAFALPIAQYRWICISAPHCAQSEFMHLKVIVRCILLSEPSPNGRFFRSIGPFRLGVSFNPGRSSTPGAQGGLRGCRCRAWECSNTNKRLTVTSRAFMRFRRLPASILPISNSTKSLA